MYRAIYLTKEDKDLHGFVWRRNPTAPLLDFRMTRVTIGVSSSYLQIIDLTRRALVSDIAKVVDVLRWYSPTIMKAKILLQLLWSERIGWDDCVP